MKITAISQGKKDRNRVNVSLDGKYAFSLDKVTLAESGFFKGSELSTDEVSKWVSKDLFRYLTRRITEYWYKRPRGPRKISEKIDKLLDGFSGKKWLKSEVDLTDSIFQYLADNNMGSEEFAKWFIDQRSQQKKYGKHKIISDLISKGLKSNKAKTYVDKYLDQDSAKIKQKLLEKKFNVSSLEEIADYKERSKAYRYLKGRGF